MIQLTKKQLERRYKEQTVRGLASDLKIAPATLIKYLKRLGIPLKGRRMKLNIVED